MARERAQGTVGLIVASVFRDLDPATHKSHVLHTSERMWPETNCYIDLWIEVLNTLRLPPEAMLGFTLTQDFEGDQFTYFKVPLEDLEALYGIRCTELAIYDKVVPHVLEQIGRGRLCLVEMDSFYMPDTQGVGYRVEHGKTTIAINRLDMAGRELDYFHNGGFFRLSGDDFNGLFQLHLTDEDLPFLPYTEFAKFPDSAPGEAAIRQTSRQLLAFHFRRRPVANPIRAFAAVFPAQVEVMAERPFGFFHKYAFNTLRQLGANFELAGSHLDWLSADFAEAAGEARRISEVAKSVQFQLARAVTRKKFEPLQMALEPAVDAWDSMMGLLEQKL
ncbi:DUF1839 family protein [Rhizobium gallicum]|uniref:DUF1839 family protein n=1 Tax=Rhizobium gallicum TaxID=56730 RepID=UPI001EF8B663|nr:DUF1839 family protein [Rhizobium gallicum]ULJ74303.1 DUF1839 family protein [Rhizobium gallicum]